NRARLTSIARLKEVVIDRLVDQLKFARVDIQVLLDLRAQALGVDNDGLSGPRGAWIVQSAVHTGQGPDCLGGSISMHRLHVDDKRPREVHQRRHQGVEYVDTAER